MTDGVSARVCVADGPLRFAGSSVIVLRAAYVNPANHVETAVVALMAANSPAVIWAPVRSDGDRVINRYGRSGDCRTRKHQRYHIVGGRGSGYDDRLEVSLQGLEANRYARRSGVVLRWAPPPPPIATEELTPEVSCMASLPRTALNDLVVSCATVLWPTIVLCWPVLIQAPELLPSPDVLGVGGGPAVVADDAAHAAGIPACENSNR